jgi:hypothetical protein
MAPLKIGNCFYNCSFTILDQQVQISVENGSLLEHPMTVVFSLQGVDFLFGLDMLKRHQVCASILLTRVDVCSHTLAYLSAVSTSTRTYCAFKMHRAVMKCRSCLRTWVYPAAESVRWSGSLIHVVAEQEIPTSERSDPSAGIATPQVPATPAPAAASSSVAPPAAPVAATSSTPVLSGSESQSDKIQRLVALGFDPQRVGRLFVV